MTMMMNENVVIFVGNITQDTVITFEKHDVDSPPHSGHHQEEPHNQEHNLYSGYRKVVNKSLGGSVMFGCLAFQHYVKNDTTTNTNTSITTNTNTTTASSSSDSASSASNIADNNHMKIHPKILTKIGKHDVMVLSQFFNGRDENGSEDDLLISKMVACESPIIAKKFHKTYQPDLSEAKHLKRMKLFDMIHVEEEEAEADSSKLTQYELLYPPFDSLENASNSRSLKCRDRGNIFKQHSIQSMMMTSMMAKDQVRALFFVPVAAEFDHHFVYDFTRHVFSECGDGGGSDFLVCTDIQGYLRRINTESGQVSHNTIEYLQEALKVLSHVVSIIKLDHEEAKKCIPNSSEMSPEECAEYLQLAYGYPIVTVTMGSSGCVCACEGEENINLSLPRRSSSSGSSSSSRNGNRLISGGSSSPLPIVKYFSSYKPVRVLDETGAGDTFLSCFVAELLLKQTTTSSSNNLSFTCEQVFDSVKLACSATSFRVEQRGLNGFSTRSQAQERVNQQPVNM